MSGMDAAFDTIRALELELAAPGVRKDKSRLLALLADDFVEFGKSGKVYTRDAIIDALLADPPADIVFADFRFKALADHAVLVTYRSDCNGVRANRSSVWVKSAGQWQMLHHQGTPCA